MFVSLERVSSWGHERGPSACLSKRVARIPDLARVASWGKTHCLAFDEAGLGVGGVCGGNGGVEGRQSTQGGREHENVKWERCKCTGTPTFGFPSVFVGPVALFIVGVYVVFAPMILQVVPWWVLFQPWSQQ